MKLDTQLLPMMMMMRFDEVISFQQFFYFSALYFMKLVFFLFSKTSSLYIVVYDGKKKDVCIRHVINDILYHIETLSLR